MEISSFKIIKILGKGDFGTVYEAIYCNDNQNYALKEIDISLNDNEQFNLISREIEIMKKISHPNIMKFYNSFKDKKTKKFYLVLEYIRGQNLRQFLEKEKKKRQFIDQKSILLILKGIVEGLCYLHQNNIIHRDITPENIMIYNDYDIKITDFGISKIYQIYDDKFNPQTIIGKLDYISPEIYKAYLNKEKKANYDFKTDIYSLGVTMYELMTYKLPFDKDIYNNKRIKCNISINPQIYNANLISIVLKMLEEDPNNRASIKDIFDELKEFSFIINLNPNSNVDIKKSSTFFSCIFSLYNIKSIKKYFESPITLKKVEQFKKISNEPSDSTDIMMSFIEIINKLKDSNKSKNDLINNFIQNTSKKILVFKDYHMLIPKIIIENLFNYFFCNINKIFIYNLQTEINLPEGFKENNLVKEEIEKFKKDYANIIGDIFCFLVLTKRVCLNCGNEIEEIIDIEYDIEFNENGDLEQLFEQFQTGKQYSNLGKKAKICKKCYTIPINLIEMKQIFTFPKVMILHFEKEVIITKRIEFNDNINKTTKNYKLISVIFKNEEDNYIVSVERENIGNWLNYYIDKKSECLTAENILNKKTIVTAFYEIIE